MPTIDLNTRGEIPVEFTDAETGAFIDPPTVRLKIQKPSQSITTYTYPNAQITKDAVGQYTTSVLFNIPGRWDFFWQGSGSNSDVTVKTSVMVNGSEFYDADGDELPDS